MPDEVDNAQYTEALDLKCRLSHISATVSDLSRSHLSPDIKRLCAACGEPIPEQRLAAVPGATRCVKCQTQYEAKRY